MTLENYSVTVMRSHDYCHFSVTLGGKIDAENDAMRLAYVDEIRKTAARLADKAVSQYKIAKTNRLKLAREEIDRGYEVSRVERIKKKPDEERTPEEKALVKAHADERWEASHRFDYEDDWDEDEEAE